MRLTRQAALAIALICGLLAAVLAWMWIGQQNKPVEKVPETVQIPVPVRTIPAQTDLQPEMFRKVTLDRTTVPAGTVLDEQKVAGQVCMTELSLGAPVLETQLALRTKALGLAYGIPRGQRAESIALDIVGAVTDFIQPGNRVDVLVSFNKNGKYVVRTVLQDILVLAAGISTSPAPPAPPPAAPAGTPGVPGAAAPPKTDPNPPKRPDMPYTLCVTPAQAQLIYVADVSGDLRLTLRGMGDHVILPLPGNNSWTLIGPVPKDEPGGGSSAPAPPPSPAPQPAPQPTLSAGQPVAPPVSRKPTVEIIRGGQRELVTPE